MLFLLEISERVEVLAKYSNSMVAVTVVLNRLETANQIQIVLVHSSLYDHTGRLRINFIVNSPKVVESNLDLLYLRRSPKLKRYCVLVLKLACKLSCVHSMAISLLVD